MRYPYVAVVFWMATAIALAQSGQAGPAFEVASVKVATATQDAPGANARSQAIKFRNEGGPGTRSPGQWICTNIPLYVLLLTAWDLNGHQISGHPSMYDTRFDIVAKVPSGTSQADFRLMIQHLLIERIGLVVHHERKELNVREVVIAKSGLKMKPAQAAPADAPAAGPEIRRDRDGNPWLPPGYPLATRILGSHGIFFLGRMQGMEDLIRGLPSDQLTIDRTGLTGKYDYTVQLPLPEADTVPTAAIPEAKSPGLPVEPFMQRLGLRLQPAKAMIDILVVDRFNRVPTEN